jgi:hypothetical protein
VAWLGIWFESLAGAGQSKSPERFRGLCPPLVYPYVHRFLEEESERLRRSLDPARIVHEGQRFNVYYSLDHDGSQTGLDQQGCRILHWLFERFELGSAGSLSARFSEIPVVIHCDDPRKAAAMGNALALLRFLSASPDQAIAKILLQPWNPLRGGPQAAAEEYEKRVIDFLHGEIFYPEEVTIFDVLERADLKPHRDLGPCCLTQIGFIAPLLEWIDECWPQSDAERLGLEEKLRNSLADEARFLRKRRPARPPR